MTLNFPQAVAFKALNEIMFLTTDPSETKEKIIAALIKFDDEISWFNNEDITKAIEKWLDTKDLI